MLKIYYNFAKTNNISKQTYAPAYAYKQFSLSFAGKKDEPKDKENQVIEIGMDELNDLLTKQLNLSDDEKQNFISSLFSSLMQEAVKVEKVPSGVSQKEEDIFTGLSQLANLQASISRPRRNVFIFSNAFATQNIEHTLSELPQNAPLYSKQEFRELLQKFNKVENSKVGDIIKATFTKTNKEAIKELIRSFDAYFIDADVKNLENGNTLEEYSLSIGEKLYVEKESNGKFKRVLRSYNNQQTQTETPNVAYAFDKNGTLSKITKFDSNSNVLVELVLDNQNKTVTIFENKSEQRNVGFQDGNFFKIN